MCFRGSNSLSRVVVRLYLSYCTAPTRPWNADFGTINRDVAASYGRALAHGKYDPVGGGHYYWDPQVNLWWRYVLPRLGLTWRLRCSRCSAHVLNVFCSNIPYIPLLTRDRTVLTSVLYKAGTHRMLWRKSSQGSWRRRRYVLSISQRPLFKPLLKTQ